MDLVHLHLLLNHLPVVGMIFLVALFAAGVVRRDATLTRTALAGCAALAVIAVAVFFTGEPAEEAVEHLTGTSEQAIEQHESVALVATLLLGTAGVLSAAALLLLRGRMVLPRWVAATGLAASVLLAGVMGATANLGGQIRHSEIRADGGAATSASAGEAGDRHRGGDDDDR